MKFSRTLVIVLITISYAFLPEGHQSPSYSRSVNHENWDGNKISTIIGNHGELASYHVYGGIPSFEWPQGSGLIAIFQDGFWLVSGKADGSFEIRTAATDYSTEYIPGLAGSNSDSSIYRIYKIASDDGPASTDWIEWPADQGAPWIDNDGDGNYDPNIDEPDVIGDLFFWYVMNDTSQEQHDIVFETEPMDVEVRASIFGFDNIYPLENTLFVKWNITNVGNTHLDSVFVGRWSDIDLGDPTDDLGGVDTTLNLGYVYNQNDDFSYGLIPPAIGYTTLQTPIVVSPGDTAWVSGTSLVDYRNTDFNSFVIFDHFYFPEPYRKNEAWYYINGRNYYNNQITDPISNNITMFMFSGDPVDSSGWIDLDRGDKKFIMSSGPFTLSPGDQQEVVEAIVISQGASDVLSVASLREDTKWVRNTWESNFTQMGAPATVSELSTPANSESIGPFDFQFSVKSNPGWTALPSGFFYEVDGVLDSTALQAVNDTVYSASSPEFSNITGTTEFKYWLKITASDSTTMSWPSAAPPNYNSFIFGPDTSAPVLTGLSNVHFVHYLVPFYKKIHLRSISDDRFGTHPPVLNWQINADSIFAVEMVEDSMQTGPQFWTNTWSGHLSGSVAESSDNVNYWTTAVDSSQGQNEGMSVIKQLQFSNRDTIGYWEGTLYNNTDNWDMFEHGVFQNGFVYGDVDWGRVMVLNLNANAGSADTMSYTRSLDLSRFNHVWLTIPMAANFRDNPNYGVLEFSDDGEFWTPQQTFTGFISPQWIHYDLSDFTAQDQFQFRFRVNCEAQLVEWVIEDIILHNDTTLLSTNDIVPLPDKFQLYQNYPNPFNPVTTIHYDLPIKTEARLTIYNVLGQEVDILLDRKMNAGSYAIKWNAAYVASGIYFYRLVTPEKQITKKLVVLK